MRSINQSERRVYVVYFDTCVYRKTLYAELIKLTKKTNLPLDKFYRKVENYQKKWKTEGKTYEDYQTFLLGVYKDMYKQSQVELIKTAQQYSEFINLHRYKHFEKVLKEGEKLYFVTDLPKEIVSSLFGKNKKISYVNKKDAPSLVKNSTFISSSDRFLDIFKLAKKSIFFNPTKELLSKRSEVGKHIIVVERKDVVYYNLSFEKLF